MRKILTIWLPFLVLLISVIIIKIQLSNQAALFSPKADQAIMSTPANNSQITNIQPETNSLSFVDKPIATQVVDFVDLKNPTAQKITITPAIPETTPSPTPQQTPTPEPTIVPATPIPVQKSPNPSPSVIPSKTPISNQTPPGSLSGDKIFDLVNDYRVSKNLTTLIKDDRSCSLAASRAPEIMSEVRSGTMHKGLADRNLPYWDNENIAYYNTEEETVKWWVSDYIHRKQIEGNFKYSCVQCYKNACAQEFTNFSPK